MRWKQHPHSALHTSGGIWQPQPVIISEITVAALATLTAEATDTLLVDFNFFFHGNSCTCQSDCSSGRLLVSLAAEERMVPHPGPQVAPRGIRRKKDHLEQAAPWLLFADSRKS